MELVDTSHGAVVGDIFHRTARGGGDRHQAGAGAVGQHVIGVGANQRRGKGASASAAGLSVDDAEFDRITYAETHVGSNVEGIGCGVDIKLAKGGFGASGLVVEGAGDAGQDGSHWKSGGSGLAGTAQLMTG